MSEFKIVKCKKCDAALTEIIGKRLTRCVQCGHNFFTVSKNSEHYVKASKSLKATPEVETLVRKLRQLKNSKISASTDTQSATKTTTRAKKTTTPLPSKKKSNPIGTIIVWIIIFNIIRSIFFN